MAIATPLHPHWLYRPPGSKKISRFSYSDPGGQNIWGTPIDYSDPCSSFLFMFSIFSHFSCHLYVLRALEIKHLYRLRHQPPLWLRLALLLWKLPLLDDRVPSSVSSSSFSESENSSRCSFSESEELSELISVLQSEDFAQISFSKQFFQFFTK